MNSQRSDGVAWLLNQHLQDSARQELKAFTGKRFRLELEEWQGSWTLLYDGERFYGDSAQTVDVRLTGNIAGLLSLSRQEALPGARLHLSGDVYAAQALQKGLAALNLNTEALLKHYFGAPLGQGLYALSQQGQAWAEQHWVRRDEFESHRARLQDLWQRLERLT